MRHSDKEFIIGAILFLVFVMYFFGKHSALVSVIGILLLLLIAGYIVYRIDKHIQYLKTETPEQKQERIHQRRKDIAVILVLIIIVIVLAYIVFNAVKKKLNL